MPATEWGSQRWRVNKACFFVSSSIERVKRVNGKVWDMFSCQNVSNVSTERCGTCFRVKTCQTCQRKGMGHVFVSKRVKTCQLKGIWDMFSCQNVSTTERVKTCHDINGVIIQQIIFFQPKTKRVKTCQNVSTERYGTCFRVISCQPLSPTCAILTGKL